MFITKGDFQNKMGQLIGSILGIITLVLFFRWNNGRKFRWIPFIVEVLGAWAIFYFGNILGDYIDKHTHISIPGFSRIPDVLKNTFGASLIISGCCALSIKSWINFNEQKKTKN
jgi:hypothetical protein